MKCKTVEVLVRRDTMTKISLTCWSWILPVLELVHGEDAIEVVEKDSCEVSRKPDAGEEYFRLSGVYGENPDSGIPLVETAYGRGKRGLKRLQKAIDKAYGKKKVANKPAVEKSAASSKTTKKVTKKKVTKKVADPLA